MREGHTMRRADRLVSEEKARENGKALQDMTLAEMDIYWNEAKHS